MGSEGVCSTSRWASLILMLEMESMTSVPDITIVEAIAISKGDQTLTAMIVEGTNSRKSGVQRSSCHVCPRSESFSTNGHFICV